MADHDDECEAGSTGTVILVTVGEIYCANVGDSRTILSRNGKLEELSTDHVPSSPLELERIEKAASFVE